MLSMLVYFSSAQLAQSQAIAPPALLPYSMLLCKNRRLFTVAGDKFVRRPSNSHALTPIPMHFIPIPMDDLTPIPMGIPWDPSLPHSHAHL